MNEPFPRFPPYECKVFILLEVKHCMGMRSCVSIEYVYVVSRMRYHCVYFDVFKHYNDVMDYIEYGWNGPLVSNNFYGENDLF